MDRVIFINPKGGTGKSTSARLFADWLLWQGRAVHLRDGDENQAMITWINNNAEEGRVVSVLPSDSTIEIVDTKGRHGAANPFFRAGGLFVCPFQGSADDIKETVDLLFSLPERALERLYLFPTMLRPKSRGRDLPGTNEQREGVAEIRRTLEYLNLDGARLLEPGTVYRPAIYQPHANGSDKNFFEHQGSPSKQNACAELSQMFTILETAL